MRRFRHEGGRRNVLLRGPWKAGAAGLKDAHASARDFRLRGSHELSPNPKPTQSARGYGPQSPASSPKAAQAHSLPSRRRSSPPAHGQTPGRHVGRANLSIVDDAWDDAARLVSFDVGGGAVIEGHCARSFDLFLSAHGLTALDRIDLV